MLKGLGFAFDVVLLIEEKEFSILKKCSFSNGVFFSKIVFCVGEIRESLDQFLSLAVLQTSVTAL